MRVRPGTVMGLVGESGCGKSVTSYSLLGLLSPGLSVRSGAISWGGVDLARADEKTLAKVRGHEIAYISQEPTRALDPMFTISWQLAAAVKRLRGVRAPRRSASRASFSPTSASSTCRACSRATRTRSRAAWPSASRSRSRWPEPRSC